MSRPNRVAFLLEKEMAKKESTKEEVKAAILGCTEKLGHVPSFLELTRFGGLTRFDVLRHFGNYTAALKECKLEKIGSGMKVEVESLFEDWTKVVRAHRKIPTLDEYKLEGRYSVRPFKRRFGQWSEVPQGMKRYVLEYGRMDGWEDVIELIDVRGKGQSEERKTGLKANSKIMRGRPLYGQMLRPCPLICAPTNEFGVIFLFGALAEQMGFQVLRLQGEYPDGEALREAGGNRLQRVKIEFEFESRNFMRHGHDATRSDLIVCWEDNWPDSPLEVIELKKIFSGLGNRT
jgi:hypothetical protein